MVQGLTVAIIIRPSERAQIARRATGGASGNIAFQSERIVPVGTTATSRQSSQATGVVVQSGHRVRSLSSYQPMPRPSERSLAITAFFMRAEKARLQKPLRAC